jgi:hypothetical protein
MPLLQPVCSIALSSHNIDLASPRKVFTSKRLEFREAIVSTLGLELAFYPNSQVRVTSVYDLASCLPARLENKHRDWEGD